MNKKNFLLSLFNKFKIRKKIYYDLNHDLRYNSRWFISFPCNDYLNRLVILTKDKDKILAINLAGSFYALEFRNRKEFKQFLFDYPQIKIDGILYTTESLQEKVYLKAPYFTVFSFHPLIKLEPL